MADNRVNQAVDAEPWPKPIIGWYAVSILTLAYIFSFIDRTIIALMVQPIKADLNLSDTQIGILHGFAFALFYTIMGLPIGWLADRKRRKAIISAGIFVWSLMTAACGLASSFWHLFLARVGVGVGEAALSPPAYSMLADFFPPPKLGRPIGVYSSGIYIGAGLAFIVGGAVVQFFRNVQSINVPVLGELFSWQLAFMAVGLPGIFIAALMMTIREPARRGQAKGQQLNKSVKGFLLWLYEHKKPMFAQIIGVSFIGIPVQAIIAWAPTYFIRVHGYKPGQAGFALGLIFLAFGATGMVAGGFITDWFKGKGHDNAPVRTGLLAAVLAIPFAISATIVAGPMLSLALLGPLIFFVSMGVGAAPTGLQLVTPNQYRAQVAAVFLLLLNLIATGFAPLLTGMATDYIFKNDVAVGMSISLVCGLATPIAAVIFVVGLKPYSAMARNLERT
jgi:MFS family permease